MLEKRPRKKVENVICFPTIVTVCEDFLSEEQNDLICDEIMSAGVDGEGSLCWLSGENSPDNSFGTRFCEENKVIQELTEKVKEEIVSHQSEVYQSSYDITLNDCWYNIYTGIKYQEFHNHLPSLISCVYYAKLPEGSSGLVLSNPFVKRAYPQVDTPNHIVSSEQLGFELEERNLFIFPSHIPHMVPIGTNKEPRITVSFNFR